MRIISGIFKGKNRLFKKSHHKTSQGTQLKSIFNILIHSDAINVKLDRSNVLDLYSGVGSFGIECIFKRCSKCYFYRKRQNCILYIKRKFTKFIGYK